MGSTMGDREVAGRARAVHGWPRAVGVGLAAASLLVVAGGRCALARQRTASAGVARSREKLAYCREDDDPNTGDVRATLWLWSPSTGRKRQLARGYNAFSPCFSPDGRRLAFLGAGKKVELWVGLDLFVLDMHTGKVRRITKRLAGSDGCHIAWRPGTNQVAVACIAPAWEHLSTGGDGGLWLVDVDTGRKRQIIASHYFIDGSGPEAPPGGDPLFSRDGSMLASLRYDWGNAVFTLDNPERWFRLDKPRLMGQVWLMDWSWTPGGKLILAATAAERSPDDLQAKHGPGGLWQWHPSDAATTRPIISVPDPHDALKRTTGPSSARPLLDAGVSVYGVAVSHDGRQVAYVDRGGVHVANLRTHAARNVLGPSKLPRLSDFMKADAEGDWEPSPPYYCLQWSPSDSYLAVSSDEHLLVLSLRGTPAVLGSVHVKEWKDLVAAWRPTGAKRP